MPKLTLEQKRLEALRRQLSGRSHPIASDSKPSSNRSSSFKFEPTAEKSVSYSASTDISYLRGDLLKVLVLSVLAIGVQLFLYSLSTHNVINLTSIHF